MRLSALLLSLVIGFGLAAPLEAKTKTHKAPKVQSANSSKHRRKPAKLKPMKFRKSKGSKTPKPVKPAKIKTRSA